MKSCLPNILERLETSDGVDYRLEVSQELLWFKGHFPGEPVLPGVVQVHWAIMFGASIGYDPATFKGLRRVKFKSIIQPGTVLHLELKKKESGIGFTYTSDSGLHSQGTIEFGE